MDSERHIRFEAEVALAAVQTVTTLKAHPVPRELQVPAVQHPKAALVAVVVRFQSDAGIDILDMPVDVVGLTQRHPGAPQTLLRHELGGGLLRKTQRVLVGGGARGRTPIGGRTARHAAVDEKQMPAGTHLEGEAAGLRIASDRKRGRRPDVDDNDARSTREPRIARSPRLARQRRSGVTISDDRSQPSGRRQRRRR